jgi:hypothetical protein
MASLEDTIKDLDAQLGTECRASGIAAGPGNGTSR